MMYDMDWNQFDEPTQELMMMEVDSEGKSLDEAGYEGYNEAGAKAAMDFKRRSVEKMERINAMKPWEKYRY